MPLVPFPEWLSHLYELMAEKHSDWEVSRTPTFETWARSDDDTSSPFPEPVAKTASDLFYLALPAIQWTDLRTALQNTNTVS